METSAHINFQGVDRTPELEQKVRQHVQELETRYGRITSCHVSIKGPGQHHQTGGLYQVRVHIALPEGRAVAVDHLSHDDERYSNLEFAVDDTFKRVRRQLQDQASKLQGKVKHHEPEPQGAVARLDKAGGFGFLETEDGREIYFHRNSVLNDGFERLTPGAKVTFAEEMGEKGPQASTVKPIGKHALR